MWMSCALQVTQTLASHAIFFVTGKPVSINACTPAVTRYLLMTSTSFVLRLAQRIARSGSSLQKRNSHVHHAHHLDDQAEEQVGIHLVNHRIGLPPGIHGNGTAAQQR